jgi:DNA-binding ferritin-like protein
MAQHMQRGKDEPRQKFGEVTESPIGLSKDVCRQVTDMLNAHLAAEYVLYLQYKKHHWVVQGAEYYQLHKFLDEIAKDAIETGDEMAERITYLGGVPIGSLAKMQDMSHIKPEQEGILDLRTMLQNDLRMTQEVLSRMRQNIEQCVKLGDHGTAHELREWLVEHEKWAHDLDTFMANESLVPMQRQMGMA